MSIKDEKEKRLVLTIVSRNKNNIQGVSFECRSIQEMMKKKEQLYKMGVLSRARITNK